MGELLVTPLVSCIREQADYHHMPYSEGHFSKVYAIEATCHAHSLFKVYSEVFRVLKPGGLFALYEWIMTEKYNSTDPYHKKLKADILVSGAASVTSAFCIFTCYCVAGDISGDNRKIAFVFRTVGSKEN